MKEQICYRASMDKQTRDTWNAQRASVEVGTTSTWPHLTCVEAKHLLTCGASNAARRTCEILVTCACFVFLKKEKGDDVRAHGWRRPRTWVAVTSHQPPPLDLFFLASVVKGGGLTGQDPPRGGASHRGFVYGVLFLKSSIVFLFFPPFYFFFICFEAQHILEKISSKIATVGCWCHRIFLGYVRGQLRHSHSDLAIPMECD